MNLRTKFILWTGALIIVIIALTASSLLYQQRKALKEERGLRGMSLVKHLAELSREPLLLKDDLALHSLVGDIVKNEQDVVYGYVGALRGKRTFFATSLDKRDDVLKAVSSLKPSGEGKVVLQRHNPSFLSEIVDYSREITVQGKTLGVAHLGISEKGITAALAKARNRVIRYSLVFFIFFVSLAFGLISLAVKPIGYLSSRALAVGEGDLETPIALGRSDELGQLAVSLDWMVKRLKQAQNEKIEKEKLKKEMDIARQIQQNLIPQDFPKIKGFEFASVFEPAQEIGGDFYDIFPIDERRLGFAIGDVAGKSISGALLMVLVRTLLRAEAIERQSPKEVLARMNHFLRIELQEQMRRFVTLLYVILDPSTRSVTCASAGHPPPLFLSVSKKTVEVVQAKGMALGITEDGHFTRSLKDKKIKLDAGDSVLLYTDGITDIANTEKEEFGEEGLIRSLRECMNRQAHEALSCIKSEIVKYAGTTPREDDVTMLLIKGL